MSLAQSNRLARPKVNILSANLCRTAELNGARLAVAYEHGTWLHQTPFRVQ
jgi:hypothetical protein